MSTGAIMDAMRERYKAPEYALMFEVGNATGHHTRRHADAVAMSLWPSRGLEIMGFEFKSYRNDWLRELKNPAKAEEIARFCDRWFVVATQNVVKPEEVPAGWGLLELAPPRKQGTLGAAPEAEPVRTLRLVKDAPRRDEAQPISRAFVAAMLRRASEADEELLRAAVTRETAVIRRQAVDDAKKGAGRAMSDLDELKKRVEEFENASGISIGRYTGNTTAIGAAVKLVLEIGPHNVYGIGARLANDVERLNKGLLELKESLSP